MAKSKGRRLAEWLRNLDSSGTVSNLTSTGIDDNATSTAITIDASENVGIGTASPAEVLHVADTTTAGAVGLRAENSEGHVNFTTNGGGFQFETGASGTVAVIDSSGNVGIGTASPTHTLHAESSSTTQLKLKDSTGGTEVRLGASASNVGFLWTQTNEDFAFGTGGSERMRIDTSGNLGIGTTSPSSKLHVRASSSGASAVADGTLVVEQGSAPSIQILSANTQIQSIKFGDPQDGDVGKINYSHSDDSFGFITNATERMRIDSAGNVGIGGSPVSSTRRLMVTDTGDVRVDIRSGADTNLGAIDFSDTSNTARGQLIYDHNNDSMQFKTLSTEVMRIDTSGNLGIGTTSPDSLLHVGTGDNLDGTDVSITLGGNTVNTRQALITKKIQSSDRALEFYAASGGSSEDIRFFRDNTNETMRIDNAGNVGIGTASPAKPLHVYSANSGGTTTSLLLQNNGSTGTVVELRLAPSAYDNDIGSTARWSAIQAINGGSGNPTELAFLTNHISADPLERMRISSTGNVGIGTESPNEKLNVSGNIRVTSGFVSFSGSISTPSEAAAVYRPSDNTLAFSTANVERMRIDSVGNVGIGTNVPVTYLSNVSGSAKGLAIESAVPVLALKDTSASDDVGYIYQSANSMRFLNFAGGEMTFRRGSSALSSMIIDSSGNVGIGTDSPSSYGYFAVDRGAPASADRTIAAFMAQSTRRMGLVWDDSKSTLGLANLTSQDLCFHIGGIGGASEIMRLQSSGNVGIGTESPVSLLHIEGNAAAGGLTLGRSSSNSAGNVLGVLQFKNEDGSNDGPNVVANIQAVVPNSNGSGGYLTFGTHDGTEGGEGSSPVERMRILSTGGITFNGDTAAANALDDYEEGTWTPVLNGSPTHSASNQYYVKIGNLVYAGAYIYSISDYTSATNFSIAGLPYATNNARGVGSVMFRDINDTTIAQLNSYISTSSSTVFFYASQNNGGNWDTLEYADGDSGLIDIIFNITYLVS